MALSYDPVTPEFISEENENTFGRGTCSSMFTKALFTTANGGKLSSHQWTNG